MMRTTMSHRRIHWRFGAASVLMALFAFAGVSTAAADTELGGFQVNATAAAISIVYNQASFGLPSGDCPTVPFDLSRTTATSDQATGHALASVAWPCDFFANASAQFGFPVYPVRAETFYPQGPTNQHTGVPLADMVASSVEGTSNAAANYGSLNFPGIVTVGQVTSTSQATKTATGALSTSTVALHDVDIMEGTIHFDSVKTTVTAESDTETAKVEGGSTYAGLTVLGVPAVIDAEGIHFEPKPPSPPGGSKTSGDSKTEGIADSLPIGNGGRAAPAQAAPTPTPSPSPTASPPPPDGPIGQITNPIIQQLEKQLENQLAEQGIEFSPSATIDVVEGASVSREVSGITITIKGETLEPYFEQLPQSLQDQLTEPRCAPELPQDIPNVPNPICYGLTFDQEITVMLGSASVKAAASPAFVGQVTTPPVGPLLPGAGGPPFGFDGTFPPTTTQPGTGGLVPAGRLATASGLPITALLLALAMGLAAVGAGGLRRFAEAATTAAAADRCALEKPQT